MTHPGFPPLDVAPPESTPTPSHVELVDALRDALHGVDLGVYDDSVLRLVAGFGEPAVVTLVSLIQRARRAERGTER